MTPLPPPWDTRRKVMIGWGRLLPEEDAGRSDSWDDYLAAERASVARSLSLRWHDPQAFEEVYGRLETEVGEDMMHHEVRAFRDSLGEAVERMRADLEAADGEPVELFEAVEGQGDLIVAAFDWDAIRDRPGAGSSARAGLWESKRAELEEWEQEQAAKLRAGR